MCYCGTIMTPKLNLSSNEEKNDAKFIHIWNYIYHDIENMRCFLNFRILKFGQLLLSITTSLEGLFRIQKCTNQYQIIIGPRLVPSAISFSQTFSIDNFCFDTFIYAFSYLLNWFKLRTVFDALSHRDLLFLVKKNIVSWWNSKQEW